MYEFFKVLCNNKFNNNYFQNMCIFHHKLENDYFKMKISIKMSTPRNELLQMQFENEFSIINIKT